MQWIELARRDHESDERREDGERHHAGFHQRDEVAGAAAWDGSKNRCVRHVRQIARATGQTYPPDGGRWALATGEDCLGSSGINRELRWPVK